MNNTTTNHNLQLILKYRQYAIYTKTIQQILILKQEGYPLNRNSSLNRGMKKIETLQDKIIEEKIQENLHGNTNNNNHRNTTNKIIEDTLTHQRKSLIRKDNGNAYKITKGNINQYQQILNNRLTKEQTRLDKRIEDEIQKAQKQRLNHKETEQQIRKTLNENKPRIKHILRDATHTNQAGLSLAGALEQGYNYKIWNNGRSRTRVRPWHRAKNIQAVEIDDVFEIFGSYRAYMMYPGDLNGGAENVANCRCWLSYTNEKPNNLKEYTSVSVGSTYKPSIDRPFGGLNITSKTKPVTEAIQSVSTGKKVTTKIKNQVRKITKPIKTTIKKIPSKLSQKFDFISERHLDFEAENGKPIDRLYKINFNKDNAHHIKKLKNQNKISIKKHANIKFEKREDFVNFNYTEKFRKFYFRDKKLTVYVSKELNISNAIEIERAIRSLPKNLRVANEIVLSSQKPLKTNGNFNRGYTWDEYPNRIYLFQNDAILETIIHESAHILDGITKTKISHNDRFKEIFEEYLNVYRNNPYLTDVECFVSPYACEFYSEAQHIYSKNYNIRYTEDFAESVRLFFVNPKRLKRDFPKKYDFVKEILDM